MPPGLDENDECSFEELGLMFESYSQYYSELYYAAHWHPTTDWTVLRGKYKCNDVRDSLFEKEKQRFSMNFEINAPIEGIQTGYLIVNGVYIKPPYKIESDMNNFRLFVNNVQIWPIARPKDIEKSDFEKYNPETNDIARQIEVLIQQYLERNKIDLNKRINWLVKYSTKEKAKEYLIDVLKVLKQFGSIYDYKIFDENNLKYDIYWCDFWGKEYPFNIYEQKKGSEVPNKTPEEIKRIKEKMAQNERESYTNFLEYYSKKIADLLKSNQVVFISASYLDMVPWEVHTEDNLISICNTIQSKLSDYKKLLRLKGIDKNSMYIFGMEILFNLKPNDCSEIIHRINSDKEEKTK